jgi:hypothetical protein
VVRRLSITHKSGGDLVGSIARETIDATPDQKMRSRLLGQAEELVNVALAIADMDTPARIAKQLRGLA